MISLVVIVLIVLMAIFAPVFAADDGASAERAVPRHRADAGRPAARTERHVLARHRRPRPRHPGPDRVRRPHLAAGRRDRDRHHGRHRRRTGACGGVPRRDHRHRPGAADRRGAVGAVPAGRDRAGVRDRAEPDRHGAGDRLLQLGVGGPDRPRSGAVAAGAGVRRGGPFARGRRPADHVRRRTAERDRAGDRLHHAADSRGDRDPGDVVVPRARTAPADAPTGAG